MRWQMRQLSWLQVIAQRPTEPFLVQRTTDCEPLSRAVLRTVSSAVGILMALLHALQTQSTSLSLVRTVLLMPLDMLTTTAGQGIAALINVAKVAQIALHQPRAQQNSAWVVTLSKEATQMKCINHAGREFRRGQWSVLTTAHKTQELHAAPTMIAQFGVIPNAVEASVSAAQARAA